MVIPHNPRLGYRTEVDSTEFQDQCISYANAIDSAIWKNEVPANVQQIASNLIHVCQQVSQQVCQRRCNDQTRAAMMALMISAKSACELGWFPQRESQELLALVDSMWKGFRTPENVTSSLNNPIILIPQVMERFYPFWKLGHILVSFEAKPESNMLVKDFHISKKMLQHSSQQRVGLFVVRTEDISKSSCIIHPQGASFLLNGKAVEKRVNISMDSGPQRPTDVNALLIPGANLLQTIGCFGGSYIIVIAFLDAIPLPDNPLLKDYVHSEVIESNSDNDIIEGPSRISLSCPISRTRIKLPVKGHVCKHLQCFDFWNYVNINKRVPSWRCPHCNQYVCYTDIRVDQTMIKILEEVGRNAVDVVISADGSWSVLTESDENVEAMPRTTHEHGDPNSSLNLGPTVFDLTRDENEMETSGGTQVDEQKPCLSEIQAPTNYTHMPATGYTTLNQSSALIYALPQLPQALNAFDGQALTNNTHMPATDYTTLNQSSGLINALPQLPQALNAFDGQQQFMNLARVNTRDSTARQALPMTFLSTSSPQDRLATNTASFHIPMPVAPSSQFEGSHVMPLGRCLGRTNDLTERWNHIYGNGINQTQLPPTPPPLQHHYAMQDQRLHIRSLSPAQDRPTPSFGIRPQTSAVNYGGTSDQRPMQRLNPGGAVEQLASHEFMNMTSASIANWRPQTRMRGSLMPGSTGYDHMIIRPTRPVQAQAQTLAPPQPRAYNNIADEIQAFLAHPSYPISSSETQAGMGSLPVGEGVGASRSCWSMPPETW